MGFEVLIFALAQTQRTWSGSNKHTNRIVADLQIQISNRDHQTVVQSWAQPLPFRTTALWLQLSPSPQKDGTKRREHRGRKEKRARERARERQRVRQQEPDDSGANEDTKKDSGKSKVRLWDKGGGGGEVFNADVKEERGGGSKQEAIFFPLSHLRVVDTVSAAVIGG